MHAHIAWETVEGALPSALEILLSSNSGQGALSVCARVSNIDKIASLTIVRLVSAVNVVKNFSEF